MSSLIQFTESGIYCPRGNFYIDPWLPVEHAVITHGHADHARPGNKFYLAQKITVAVMRHRLGENNYQAVDWKEPVYMNGVRVSFHPSGHIAGAAQVRIEYKGEVWVAAGDYKVMDDGISGAFEPLQCHFFITESTFGLPIYNWQPQERIFSEILDWIARNKANGKSSVLIAYSLGKAQRVIEALRTTHEKIYAHGAVFNMQDTLIQAGVPLMPVTRVNPDTPRDELKSAVIVAPSGAEGSGWIRRFDPYEAAICSGWTQVRGNVRRSPAGRGFALSDHADWGGLLSAIKATQAQKVFVTHGFQSIFSRYLNESGIASEEIITQFGDDEGAITEKDSQNEEP